MVQNPGMGIKINDTIPDNIGDASFEKALDYMGFEKGESLVNKEVNYVFIGSCTNSRIEDFRIVAEYIKGKQKTSNVNALIDSCSQQVAKQIIEEGLTTIFKMLDLKSVNQAVQLV